uniref:Uncharacterized protein n=1 Tax=Odontella aurita TaxID=265563 RepID=A0A7S4NBD8_9STRA|mmetsp:Transcript_56177/g.168163  ORF Transcript_56177/g.168163 Transcript_56177/m.168163 type:complete len:253 (+) Transcript_56177:145-903(+)
MPSICAFLVVPPDNHAMLTGDFTCAIDSAPLHAMHTPRERLIGWTKARHCLGPGHVSFPSIVRGGDCGSTLTLYRQCLDGYSTAGMCWAKAIDGGRVPSYASVRCPSSGLGPRNLGQRQQQQEAFSFCFFCANAVSTMARTRHRTSAASASGARAASSLTEALTVEEVRELLAGIQALRAMGVAVPGEASAAARTGAPGRWAVETKMTTTEQPARLEATEEPAGTAEQTEMTETAKKPAPKPRHGASRRMRP